jgi:hypothetical protein
VGCNERRKKNDKKEKPKETVCSAPCSAPQYDFQLEARAPSQPAGTPDADAQTARDRPRRATCRIA